VLINMWIFQGQRSHCEVQHPIVSSESGIPAKQFS
jgi:hypothetical protein